MNTISTIILFSFISGITVFIGGLLSFFYLKTFHEKTKKSKFIHTSIAFGGGVLIAAVALVLVPEGMKELDTLAMSVSFVFGVTVFFYLDKIIEQRGGEISQLLAMMLDFIPEAIALGAMFGANHTLGILLALFIGLQNLPEAFNSYIELKENNTSTKKSLLILLALSFTGILASLSGYYFLSDSPQMTASLMLFASGGIIYLMFQDIAPLSKLPNSWFPAVGASVGFFIGMIGQKLLG